MKLLSNYDLLVQYQIIAQLNFIINNEKFDLKGKFVRKKTKVECKQFIYGIQFLELSKQDEYRLGKVITEIQLEKKKI
jgi:hypothetical protein